VLLQTVKMLAALSGVLGLIFGLAWLFRRFNLGGARTDGGGEGWRVLGIRMLGPKRHIYILEVGSRLLLVGATDRTLATLAEITDPAECQTLRDALARKKKTLPGFADFLKRAES
jgi:flagellar biosynthetic protein FliO